MAEKYLCKSSIFKNIADDSSFWKVSLHFKKMTNSSRKVLKTIRKDFHKQLVKGTLNVLGKSLKIVLDEIHFTVNLYSSSLSPVSTRKLFLPPGKSLASVPGTTASKTFSSSRKINKGFSLYLFLNSEPWLDKSGESNNQEMKESGVLRTYSSFLLPKNQNKRADRLCIKLSCISNTSVPECLSSLFQRSLLSSLFWGYLNPLSRMLDTFLSNLFILPWLGNIFKFMGFTFLENALNLVLFTHASAPSPVKTPPQVPSRNMKYEVTWNINPFVPNASIFCP